MPASLLAARLFRAFPVLSRSSAAADAWHLAFLDRALRSARACEAAERIARQNAEPQAPAGFAPYPRLP